MSRVPKNPLIKSTTSLSINDRFTRLRGVTGQTTIRQTRENNSRDANSLLHQASIKNRRLAQQMERRPTVMAALKLKKKSIRQRLGPFDNSVSVQDRLLFPVPSGRARIRGRARGRGLSRGRSEIRGRVSVLASPRGIRRGSFVQRNRGGVLQRQVQNRLQINQQRGHQLTDLRENRVMGSRQLGGRLRGNRLRGIRGRGSTTDLRTNQFRTNLHTYQFRTNELRGSHVDGSPLRGRRLHGMGLRGTGLRRTALRGTRQRGMGLRGSGLRGSGLRGSGLRGSGLRRSGLRGSGLRGSGLRESRYRGSGILRGQGQSRRQVHGGQLRRNQFVGGYEQRARGVHGGQQHYRGNQQSNQRGLFRGLGRNQFNQPKPSKEELDNELDQYMSNSDSRHDYHMDSYLRRDASNSWR